MMDDDVRKLIHIENDDSEELIGARAREMVKRGFDMLAKRKMQIFGFYPKPNRQFMLHHPEVTEKLSFIAGPIYGLINDRDVMQPRANLKTD